MALSSPRPTRRLLLAAVAFTFAFGVARAPAARSATDDTAATAPAYEPALGQPGKDVMWLPTAESLVDRMLNMAAITPEDYLIDLGSGDGRTVITAAQRGTRAHGIEFHRGMVELSQRAAREAGVSGKATFAQGDIFESDFSQATVVTLFLLPELNLRLRPALLAMKPGTRIVSNSFDMGEWAPDATVAGGSDCRTYCQAYKWIVPAQVEGSWDLGGQASLDLGQSYQKLNGHLVLNGERHAIDDAVLEGARIVFTANGRKFTGTVDGDRMTGSDGNGNAWSATRQRRS